MLRHKVNCFAGVLIVTAAFLLGFSGSLFCQTADQQFELGKTDLEQESLAAAHTHFQNALAIDPNHDGANFFYALTSLLMISNSPELNSLLDRAGVSADGRNIFQWQADLQRDAYGNVILPDDTPTGAELQDFVKNTFLPRLNESINIIGKVRPGFQTSFNGTFEEGEGSPTGANKFTTYTSWWDVNDWAGYKLVIAGSEYEIISNDYFELTVSPNLNLPAGTYEYEIVAPVEIDYGDALVARGGMLLAKAGILIFMSYNFDVDIDYLVSLINTGDINIETHVLPAYPQLLMLLPDQKLAEAKAIIREAIAQLSAAADWVINETDPQENDLFILHERDAAQFPAALEQWNTALDGPVLMNEPNTQIDLSQFFDHPRDLRDYLPVFDGTLIVRGTFPNPPTFGGILPAMTETELNNILEENDLLVPGVVAQITLATNPAGIGFTVDGLTFSGPRTFRWVVGSSHLIAATSPPATGGTRHTFVGWSDGGAVSHFITVPASGTTYTANFITQNQLNAMASPPAGGTVTADPASGDGFYGTNASVKLTVTPNAGYVFQKWSGDLTGSASPQQISMSLPRNVTAIFSAMNPEPQLTGIGPGEVMAGGTAFDLEVYGQSFVPDSRVWFNGKALNDAQGAAIEPTFLSSRQLKVRVPASYITSANTVPVSVYSPGPGGGQSTDAMLNVGVPQPVLTGLTMQSVPAGKAGYEVGILGARFVKESVAEWNGSARTTLFVNSSRLTIALEPEDIASVGTGTITVLNPGGGRSNGRTLDIVALAPGSPEIRSLSPDVIDPAAGGFTLTVDGSGYVAGSKVLWNGVEKTTYYESAERLSADIAAGDLGASETNLVSVRNPSQAPAGADGSGLGSNTAVVSNRNKAPLLEGLTPAAVVAGSAAFQLKITGWGYAAGKTVVSWNNEALQSTYVNDGELSVDIPPALVARAGVATIRVENPAPGGGSQTKTFTILGTAGTRESLMYPRLVNDGGGQDSTGVVWANLSGTEAKLTAWAYGNDGNLIKGEKITNPVVVTVPPQEQQAIMDSQLFGEGFRDKRGWLKLDSTETGVLGFSMMFDDRVTHTDGSNALQQGMEEFVFSEIEDEQEGFTQLYVGNPNSEAVTVRFELINRDGGMKKTVDRTIQSHGTLAEPIATLFSQTPLGSDYVRVESGREVVGFEYMGKTPKYVYGLNGQDSAAGGLVLYGPQYVVGGGQWRTTLSVVNLDDAPGTVTFRLISPEGKQKGSTRSLLIQPKGKLEITDQNFFLQANAVTTGYVEIRSDGPRLAGNLVFGDPAQEEMASSLPLVAGLAQEMVFGHVVSNELWWTGIALLNPWASSATITVKLYDRAGKQIGEEQDTIAAGQQQIGLLWQYFEWLGAQNQQGYIRVTSSKPLAGLALFGTNKLDVISAIPAQSLHGQ